MFFVFKFVLTISYVTTVTLRDLLECCEKCSKKVTFELVNLNICHLNKNLLVIQICSHFKDAVIKIYSIHVITK